MLWVMVNKLICRYVVGKGGLHVVGNGREVVGKSSSMVGCVHIYFKP